MATPTRAANVGLYRKLLKAAQNFEPYNIRDYAVRYVRDDFRAAAVLSGQEVRPVACAARSPSCRLAPPISQALDAFQHGMTQLEMLRRQSTISQMFPQDRHAAPLRQRVLPGAAGHGWPLISPLCAGTLSPPPLCWPTAAMTSRRWAGPPTPTPAPRGLALRAGAPTALLPLRQVMEESRPPPTSTRAPPTDSHGK